MEKRTGIEEIRYGCGIEADGGVYSFRSHSMGTMGGGPTTIPASDQKRLDKLLSKLPDDGARLPHPGRRVVLQVPEGGHCRARVYDRANAPDEILEILRLSRSGVRAWVPKFKSEKDVPVNENCGMFAVPPNRIATMDRSGKFWDLATHKELMELPLSYGRNSQGIKFSPDGSLAVSAGFAGWEGNRCSVIDAKTGKVVRHFQEPMVGRQMGILRFPQFTADGRFLLLLCFQPDGNGHVTVLPRVYDTKTWVTRDKLPGFPENALTCIEAPKGKRAVVLLKGSVAALWDRERHREYAKLDEDVQIRQVAFSPDESMVAMATLHERGDGYWPRWTTWGYRIRIWKMATGELVHELYPFEQDACENVVGLQWTADGQYILAATKPSGSYDINIWNVKSGRHRGNLTEGFSLAWGAVIVPDESRVAVCGGVYLGTKGVQLVRFWDLAAALKQIRAFEDSLAGPRPGK